MPWLGFPTEIINFLGQLMVKTVPASLHESFLKYDKIKIVKIMEMGWGHNRENYFYMCLYWKNIEEFSSQEPLGQKNSNYMKAF
jgi:hypothetical protein